MLKLSHISQAQARLAPHLQPTPLETANGWGDYIHLKLENANRTHSFKVRGALNALFALKEAADEGQPDARSGQTHGSAPTVGRTKGVVTASSGNHAQGLAYAAHLTGVKAKILMPEHTPRRKVDGVIRYGAEAVLLGATYDEAENEARRLEREAGLTFISPYNDPLVIAGGGTIGLEILDALPDVARVVVPVGGGGIISGIALAVKSLRPDVEVIGVCALSAPAMYNAFYGTDYPQVWDTLAEALSGQIEDGSITLELAKQHVDQIVLVTEDQISAAMRWMADEQGWIVEGGGAVGVAALLDGVIAADQRQTVFVITGGNVDGTTLRQVLCR